MKKTNTATATASKASKTSENISGTNLRTSGLGSMKSLIIGARRTNNEHAISKDEFLAAGLTEQAYDQWVLYVSNLRDKVKAYTETLNDKDVSESTQARLEGSVWATWRDVLKNASQDEFSEKWFVRKRDISLLVRCDLKKVKTAIGSQEGHYSPTDFRRLLEWIIGARIVSAKLLSDKDVEVIEGYEGALRSIDSANKRLKGYSKGDKVEIGLIKSLASAKSRLAEVKKLLETAKLEGEALKAALKPYEKGVSDLETEISAVKKSLKTAEEKRDKLQAAYTALIAERKRVEGIA